jgi:hypothetical protein
MKLKRITLGLDDKLFRKARHASKIHKTTLNLVFREWLKEHAAGRRKVASFEELAIRSQAAKSARRIPGVKKKKRLR